jgi:hypothetical protein
MDILASNPFIGPGGNNFSHKIKSRTFSYLSQIKSTCPVSVQFMSGSDSASVLLCSTSLSRYATEAERLPPCLRPPAPVVFPKKTAARESPLPPSVLTATVFALCLNLA